MSAATVQLDEISDILARDLKGSPFAVLRNDRYVVVVSDKYGVATIAGDREPASAPRGALEIAKQAGLLGINVQVHPFIVSEKAEGDGDMFLRPNATALDLKAALEGKSGGDSGISLENANKLVDFLNGRVRQTRKQSASGTIQPLSAEFKRLLVACAKQTIGESKPWVAGVQITADHVVSEDFMLGPLLYVAAENWTPPYLAAKRQGGFTFSVKEDESSILGYRVTGISVSSPAIVALALASVIRSHTRKGACILDPCLLKFANFMGEITGDANIFGDMDTMIMSPEA